MTEESKPVMFLGRHRTGLTRYNAAFYMRVVRTLLRCGAQDEGMLANRVRENLGSKAWNECMDALSEWQIVEFEPARHGRARVVALTAEGKGCAIEYFEDPQFDDRVQPDAERTAAK